MAAEGTDQLLGISMGLFPRFRRTDHFALLLFVRLPSRALFRSLTPADPIRHTYSTARIL